MEVASAERITELLWAVAVFTRAKQRRDSSDHLQECSSAKPKTSCKGNIELCMYQLQGAVLKSSLLLWLQCLELGEGDDFPCLWGGQGGRGGAHDTDLAPWALLFNLKASPVPLCY